MSWVQRGGNLFLLRRSHMVRGGSRFFQATAAKVRYLGSWGLAVSAPCTSTLFSALQCGAKNALSVRTAPYVPTSAHRQFIRMVSGCPKPYMELSLMRMGTCRECP